MPEVISTTVYRLNELPASAASQARAWYRTWAPDDGWNEFVFDDFERICAILGIDLARHAVRLYGGGKPPKPCEPPASGRFDSFEQSGIE